MSSRPNTIITISRVGEEPDCSVCKNEGSAQVCQPKQLVLKDALNASVEFTCPQPQDVFTVSINIEIGEMIADLYV